MKAYRRSLTGFCACQEDAVHRELCQTAHSFGSICWKLQYLKMNFACIIIFDTFSIVSDLTVPHLFPCNTGQAPCLVLSSPIPDLSRFHQNAAEPFLGQRVTPALVKTVAPPEFTSDSYFKRMRLKYNLSISVII